MANKQGTNTKQENKKKVTKITMKTNFSSPIKPSKKQKVTTWGNYIDVYETLVAPIVIVVATRMDKPEGSFITPMVRAFNEDDSGNLSSKWKILAFLSRKNTESTVQDGVRNAMLKGSASSYEWEAIVGFVDRDKDNAKDVGMNIAAEFSSFSKNDRQVRLQYVINIFTLITILVEQ